MPTQCVPRMFDRVQIWWFLLPRKNLDNVFLQNITSSMWSGVIDLEHCSKCCIIRTTCGNITPLLCRLAVKIHCMYDLPVKDIAAHIIALCKFRQHVHFGANTLWILHQSSRFITEPFCLPALQWSYYMSLRPLKMVPVMLRSWNNSTIRSACSNLKIS